MTISLKRYFLTNAFIIVMLATIIAITATFFLRQESAKLHLDTELSLETHMLESLLVKRLSPLRAKRIQEKINSLPTDPSFVSSSQEAVLQVLASRSKFQLWDLTNQQLILHSPQSPDIPFSNQIDYYYATKGKNLWRAYSLVIPKLNYKIVSLQRHDRQLQHEKQFITDTLIVLGLSFSFIIFSLGLVIQRGLSVLDKAQSQLSKREPDSLTPLPTDNQPLEIKPLLNEINRLMKKLKSAFEREQTFAANAAHELKTPLSAMSAQIQVALMQPVEKQKEAFLLVESSIKRYDHIIKQLLTLSRTISHASLETAKPIPLIPLLQKTIAQLVPLASKKNISLELQHQDHPVLSGNEVLITTALQNLIDNAIKYSVKDDTIVICVCEHNNQVIIEVIDHGPGISDSEKPLALLRFKRLGRGNGSGLGLNIISEICKQLKGTLSLEDTEGGGLTAKIVIPKP